jgi:4'-phosphopantetheinyl transferase
MRALTQISVMPVAYYCRTIDITDHQLDKVRTWFSAEERARHDMLSIPDDRRAFAAAHGLLRQVLATTVGGSPAQVMFDRDGYGKPFLVPGVARPTVAFSLSHCRDVVACVVTPAGRVGIDVEPIRPSLESVAFAQRFFSPAEAAWIAAMPSFDRGSGVCAVWTLKEALSKALGYGLGLPLTSTSFEIYGRDVTAAVFPPFDDDVWHCRSIDIDGTHKLGVVANAAAAAAPVDVVEMKRLG